MKEAGLSEPEFINKRNEFVVILYNSETETVINNEADTVYSCVRKQKIFVTNVLQINKCVIFQLNNEP